MANRFSKNDIIAFIQDSISQYGGLNPNMVKDIKALVDAQAEMGNIDDYVKTLAQDNEEIKRLLQDVLEGKATQDISIDNTSNVNIKAETDKSFRDALDEQISSNSNIVNSFVGKMTGAFRDIYSTTVNSFRSQLNSVFGSEKEVLFDPLVSFTTGILGVFGKIQSYEDAQLDFSRESRDSLSNIYTVNDSQLSVMEDVRDALDDTYKLDEKRFKIEKEQHLAAMRQKKEGEKSLLQKIIEKFIVVGIAGLISGAIVGSILLPFQVLGKGIMSLARMLGIINKSGTGSIKFLNNFFEFFKKFSFINKSMNILKNFKVFRSVSGFFAALGTLIAGQGDIVRKVETFFNVTEGIGDAAEDGVKVAKQLKKIPLIGDALFKMANVIHSGLRSIIMFFKNSKVITGIFAILKTTFSSFTKVSGLIFSLTTNVGMFVNAFAYGLKWLAWPLTILLGVIDFFKGFMGSSETTFFGKIKDGIKQVIVGFFEMPLRLLGWIYDKALQYLGLESEGTGDKIVKALGDIVEGIFAIIKPVAMVVGFLVKMALVQTRFMIGTIKNTFKLVKTVIGSLLSIIWTPVSLLIDAVKNTFIMIKDIAKGIFKVGASLVATIIGVVGGIIKFFYNVFTLDFDAALKSLGGIKEVVIAGVKKMFSGILDIIRAPYDYIKRMIKSLMGHLGNIIKNFFNIVLSPFFWIGNQLSNFHNYLKDAFHGTFLDPVLNFFDTIAGFINRVIDWAKEKIKSIPLVGNILKDESDEIKEQNKKDTEVLVKINNERADIRDQIAKLEKDRAAKGEGGGLFSKTRSEKIAILKDKQAKLDADVVQLNAGIDGRSKKIGIVNKTNTAKLGMVSGVSKVIADSKNQLMANIGTGPRGSTRYSNLATSSDIMYVPQRQTIPSDFDTIEEAKSSAIRKQIAQSSNIEKTIVKMNKYQQEAKPAPIIINNDNSSNNTFDPPEDIESMSVLWLNKSWGLG